MIRKWKYPPHLMLNLHVHYYNQGKKYYVQEYHLDSRQHILKINTTFIQEYFHMDHTCLNKLTSPYLMY